MFFLFCFVFSDQRLLAKGDQSGTDSAYEFAESLNFIISPLYSSFQVAPEPMAAGKENCRLLPPGLSRAKPDFFRNSRVFRLILLVWNPCRPSFDRFPYRFLGSKLLGEFSKNLPFDDRFAR